MKLIRIAPVLEAFEQLGYSTSLAVPIGLVLLISTAIYMIPPTSVLGAILLTGYLGGATATHVRAGQPFYFPVVFGVLVWAGLYLGGSGCAPSFLCAARLPATRANSENVFLDLAS
jgi:hypothetical protein